MPVYRPQRAEDLGVLLPALPVDRSFDPRYGEAEQLSPLIRRVLAEVPGSRLTGHPTERLPGHASFVVERTSGESLLVALDSAGISASSGSASPGLGRCSARTGCSSGGGGSR